jgi:hypothetical protein
MEHGRQMNRKEKVILLGRREKSTNHIWNAGKRGCRDAGKVFRNEKYCPTAKFQMAIAGRISRPRRLNRSKVRFVTVLELLEVYEDTLSGLMAKARRGCCYVTGAISRHVADI